MKAALAIALLAMLGTAAEAKYAPVEPQRAVASPDESAVLVGPVGAMLESDYFRAPREPKATRVFPCRLQISVFQKTQLAQSCH